MTALIYNAIRTPDGTVLVSRHRHDHQTHLDANGRSYMIDGGLDYCRRSANGDEVDMCVYDAAPHHRQRRVVVWGSYGKSGQEPLRYILVADMEMEHIKAVLRECKPAPQIRACLEKELDARLKGEV